VIGSARLDAVRRPSSACRRRRRRSVLYVPDVLRGNLRYLSCNDYPDVSYYELQARVVALFGEFPDVDVLYKAFNDTVPNPILTALDRPSNVRAVGYTEAKITTLMWEADLVALDIPSTALLECLLTPAAIVVYADARSLRLRPEARQALQRRCVVAENPDAYLDGLRAWLTAPEHRRTAGSDDTFLREYGVAEGRGRVASRAADAVLEIAGTPDRK
jgi:hypothetical protein